MADSVASLLPRLRPLVPDLLKGTEIQFRMIEGTAHLPRSGWHGCSSGGELTYQSLDQLRPSRTCGNCLRAYRLRDLGAAGPLLADLVELLHQVKRSGGVTTSSTVILRQRAAHQKAHESFVGTRASTEVTDADAARLERLQEESDQELVRLTRLLRSPQEKETALRRIQEEFLGEIPAEYVFDTTPTLVSIYPYVPSEWNQATQALVEQCTVRTNPLVLELPRYAADHLATQPRARAHGYQPTASAHDMDASQIETAALLWEPRGTGPMVSLRGAAEAARALGPAGS